MHRPHFSPIEGSKRHWASATGFLFFPFPFILVYLMKGLVLAPAQGHLHALLHCLAQLDTTSSNCARARAARLKRTRHHTNNNFILRTSGSLPDQSEMK